MRSRFKLGTVLSLVITAAMASCGSDETAPTVCGNGVAEGDEVCDGADLRGATCQGSPNPTAMPVCATNCAAISTAPCGGGVGGQGGAGPNP